METLRTKSVKLVTLVTLLSTMFLAACGDAKVDSLYQEGDLVRVTQGVSFAKYKGMFFDNIRNSNIESTLDEKICRVKQPVVDNVDENFVPTKGLLGGGNRMVLYGLESAGLEGVYDGCDIWVAEGALSPYFPQDNETLDNMVEPTEQPTSLITPIEYQVGKDEILTGIYFDTDKLGEVLQEHFGSYYDFERDVMRLTGLESPDEIQAGQIIRFTVPTDYVDQLK